ncbi:MAG: T9SS type A sorting domain-containing protein [Paludibacter sp.]|nr:T9SS type A sorting domain-containing protein [Paludibacter sp.]
MTHCKFTSAISGRNFSFFGLFGVKFLSVLLILLLVSGESWGQLYWNTNGTTAAWTTANWGTSSSGTFNNPWVENSDVVFTANSAITYITKTSIGNVTLADGVNVTVTTAGTLYTNETVRTFTIGIGSVLTWTSQPVQSNSSSGFIKSGAGTWNIGAQSNDYNGGFTLNDGTTIVSGSNSFGGTGSLLTINGGIIQTSLNKTYLNNINIGGDFTFTGTGETVFSGLVNLGSTSRMLTNSISSGSKTFSGVISGISGTGITLIGSSAYPINFTSNNTYNGVTIINGSTLILNATGGALSPGNAVSIGGGTLEIAQSQTIGNFTMTSGTLKVDAGQTLTITGTYDVTGGTINNLGTIILKGTSAQNFPGSSVTINNGTSGQMTNLTIDNSNGASLDNSLTINTLTINSSSKLNVNIGITINATTFNINSDENGTGTFINNGTFSATTSKVQQYLSSARNWYISSPVTGATVPTGKTYFGYQEPGDNIARTVTGETDYWKAYAATSGLTVGKGYIAQPTEAITLEFTGTLNSGTVGPLTLTRTTLATKPGFNLVGNPFPAYLNIDGLESNTDLEPSYWYRSYNSGYVFDTYNIPSELSTGLSGLSVSKFIPPMQAFWLRVANGSSTASVSFSSTNCVHQNNENNKFRAPSSTKSEQKVLRLMVSNGTYSDETILYANPNALDGFDQYDSHKYSNNNIVIPEIYTQIGSEQLVINGMSSLPINTVIPLGFKSLKKGLNSFSMKASQFSNFDSDIKVVLKDVENTSNSETDITDGTPYSFTSDSITTESRFSIIFKSISGTTALNTEIEDNIVIYKNADNHISVKTNNNIEGNINVYNSLGQKVVDKPMTGNLTIIENPLKAGIYIVTVTNSVKTSAKQVVIF